MTGDTSLLIPLILIMGGVSAITIYVLAMAVRHLSSQLAQQNERLMVMLGTLKGGDSVGRALVASSRPPQGSLPGVSGTTGQSKKKEKPKSGFTMGVRG